ncbi:MAG: ribosome biogenesis GTP-binding protein YihA/YsxC [Clostridiales bacterium]|nr:ribosome biogenesis GTP-binding protein YihA/YsxC [Clostridiales bacterium]
MRFDNARFEMACGTFAQLPACTAPEIAFSGRSNVGKSSLLNKLLNRKSLARVSAKPGKTITINFYALDGVRLTDLPGYGYAKVAQSEKKRWAEMMEGYFGSGREIRLVIQLIDLRHPPSADDLSMLDYLAQMQYPFVIALTKCDKLNKTERAARMEALKGELAAYPEIRKIPFSAVTGEGAEDIRTEIAAAVEENT